MEKIYPARSLQGKWMLVSVYIMDLVSFAPCVPVCIVGREKECRYVGNLSLSLSFALCVSELSVRVVWCVFCCAACKGSPTLSLSPPTPCLSHSTCLLSCLAQCVFVARGLICQLFFSLHSAYKKAVELTREKKQGILPEWLNNIGCLQRSQGFPDAAEASFSEALQIQQSSLQEIVEKLKMADQILSGRARSSRAMSVCDRSLSCKDV